MEAGTDHAWRPSCQRVGDRRGDDRPGVDQHAVLIVSESESISIAVDIAGQSFEFDSCLRLVVDGLPYSGDGGDRVEQPAHARRRYAPESGLELVPQNPSFLLGTGLNAVESRVPRHTGGVQVRQCHSIRPVYGGVAAGKGDVLQVGRTPETLVVGNQNFATPYGAVGAVSGTVECEAEDLCVAGDSVLTHDGSNVCMVV